MRSKQQPKVKAQARTWKGLRVRRGEEDGVDGEVVEPLDEEGEGDIYSEDEQAEEGEVEVEAESGREKEEDDGEQKRSEKQLIHVVRVRVDALTQHVPFLPCHDKKALRVSTLMTLGRAWCAPRKSFHRDDSTWSMIA